MAGENSGSSSIFILVIVGLGFYYLSSAVNNPSSNAGAAGGAGSYSIIWYILAALAIYYLYKWLYGDGSLTDVILYSPVEGGLPGKSSNPKKFTADTANMPGLYDGGEYSVSTWIYVNNWDSNRGFNKPFLQLSGGGGVGGFQTLVLYLGQNMSKLGVRVSTENMKLTASELGNMRPISGSSFGGGSNYGDNSSGFLKCDIENVELQRWVNVTVILNGRTVDVYIDGRMSRSCVLDGVYVVSGNSTSLALGGPFGFGGLIGKTQVADFAYSPDRVYQIYQSGPFDTSLSTRLSSMFNPPQFAVSVKMA